MSASTASARGAYCDLPPEVWQRVIQHLYRPLPAPNSGAERCDLTQPHLATCMRVSPVSLAFYPHGRCYGIPVNWIYSIAAKM
jgi:hypothetical protein